MYKNNLIFNKCISIFHYYFNCEKVYYYSIDFYCYLFVVLAYIKAKFRNINNNNRINKKIIISINLISRG